MQPLTMAEIYKTHPDTLAKIALDDTGNLGERMKAANGLFMIMPRFRKTREFMLLSFDAKERIEAALNMVEEDNDFSPMGA